MSNNYKNSFISMMEDLALLNKNSVEILTKLNETVTSADTSITIDREDANGDVSHYQLPTVNYLKKQIDTLSNTIKSMTDPTIASYVVEGNSTKKFFSMDLKREPTPITNINAVSEFNSKTNWFFEALMNPLLSVKLDLNDKIGVNINKILSRRYIIDFEKNKDGTYTKNGKDSLTIFKNKFVNRNDFSIVDFETWIKDVNNKGVLHKNDINNIIDEEVFDINFKKLQARGFFSVLKIEVDDVNNKIWYHLNTSMFETREGNKISLQESDELVLSRQNSNTRYKIIETSNKDNTFKVSLERIEGFDPVPIGENMLEYYSTVENDRFVRISVGFDEYNVIFLKSIDTGTDIISSLWSKGTAFYTNDLVMDRDNNISLQEFYSSNVDDYGKILKDFTQLYIPSTNIISPQIPVLNKNNFKVVQINKHLTDNENTEELGKLHSKKEATKSKVEQITKAIIDLNNEINNTSFASSIERDQAYVNLNNLYNQQEAENKTLASIIQNINSLKFENIEQPKYAVRGFWEIPENENVNGIEQYVVKFIIQYRYSSKGSNANSTEGFALDNFKNSDGKVITTGYFSNWNEHITHTRRRFFDKTTNTWIWETEDLSSADQNNINSLDIPLKDNEKVEIRIKSISNVGYPITQIESNWSDILPIEFPVALSKSDTFIKDTLDEAAKDEVIIRMNNELNSKGVFPHIKDSYSDNDVYIAHKDRNIVTSFKDSKKEPYLLSEYLNYLTNKIKACEEKLSRIKGELQVLLVKGGDSSIIKNNTTKYVTIECEDYGTKVESSSDFRKYVNTLYNIKDYKVVFKNISGSEPLYFLTNKKYKDSDGIITSEFNKTTNLSNRPFFISSNNKCINQGNKQKIWICDTSLDGSELYVTNSLTDSSKNLGLASQGTTENSYVSKLSIWNTAVNQLEGTLCPVLPDNEKITNDTETYSLGAKGQITIPLSIFFKFGYSEDSDKNNFKVLSSLNKDSKTRSIRFYTQTGDNNEPFTCEIEFTLNRFKDAIFVEPPKVEKEPIVEVKKEIEPIEVIEDKFDNYTPHIIKDDIYDYYNYDYKEHLYGNYWDIYDDEIRSRDRWSRREYDDFYDYY